jgi:HSP20 family protein
MKATFELPGLTKDDISIDLHRNHLTISGERKSSSEHKSDDNSYVIRERRFGKFEQSVPIPEGTKVSTLFSTFV